jgi:hypothetical protein
MHNRRLLIVTLLSMLGFTQTDTARAQDCGDGALAPGDLVFLVEGMAGAQSIEDGGDAVIPDFGYSPDAGTTLRLVAGPICDREGIAWWEVDSTLPSYFPEAALEPFVRIDPQPTDDEDIVRAEYAGVSFEYTANLLPGGELYAAHKPAEGEDPTVEAVEFVFHRPQPDTYELPDGTIYFRSHTLRVQTRVEDSEPAFHETPVTDDQPREGPATPLSDLLARRPDLQPADPLFSALYAYLDFEGGAGLRRATNLAQLIVPAHNPLDYLVTGLSDDGQFLIEVGFEFSTPLLERETQAAYEEEYNWVLLTSEGYFDDGYDAELDAYFSEWEALLNAAAPDQFTPSLDDLDRVFTTLRIEDIGSN